MKEKTITNQILKYLNTAEKCVAFKHHGGMYSQAGIPDIICCYRGKFVAFEVKNEKGKLSKLQEYWLKKFSQADGIAYKVQSLDEVKEIIKSL